MNLGKITWTDLTTPNARRTRDFYRKVVGWKVQDVDMGGYSDYAMVPRGSAAPVAGICHAQGVNADLPAQWLVYVNVANLARSLAAAKRHGGKLLTPARDLAGGRMCVVQDPAGAVCALFQPPDAPRRPRTSKGRRSSKRRTQAGRARP